MFDNDNRMTFIDQGIESLQQRLDIMKMQTGRRLVKDEKRRFLFLLAQIASKFSCDPGYCPKNSIAWFTVISSIS